MDRLPAKVLTLILEQLALDSGRAAVRELRRYSLVNKTFFSLCQRWIWEVRRLYRAGYGVDLMIRSRFSI